MGEVPVAPQLADDPTGIADPTLRLLIVEDSEQDARLIEWEIRHGGFDVAMTRVEGPAEMGRELGSHAFDLVISDHALPGSTIAETLAVFRESRLDIPFLIVSGTMGEEAAGAALREGASDYLPKDRLGRLVPVIQRELSQAAERRAGREARAQLTRAEAAALKEATERAHVFEVLHEISAASTGVFDVRQLAELTIRGALELVGGEGAMLQWWDRQAGQLRLMATTDSRGWAQKDCLSPRRSILGEAFLAQKAIVNNDYQRAGRSVAASRNAGVTALVAVPLMVGDRAAGALGVVSYGSRTFTASHAKILGLLASQVAAAIEAAGVRSDLVDSVSLLEQSQEVGAIGTFVSWLTPEKAGRDQWSPMTLRIFGHTEQTYDGTSDAFWKCVHPDDIERVRTAQAEARESGSVYEISHRIVRPGGEVRWIHERAVVDRDPEGRPIRFLGVTRDITDEVLAGQALRESVELFTAGGAALLASEARNAAVIDATLDAMIVLDSKGVVTAFNPAAEQMFGYDRDGVIGRELAGLLLPKRFRRAHRHWFRTKVESGHLRVASRVELVALRAAGGEFPIELSVSRLETDGTPSFSGYIRDLTDRDRLGESEALLAKVVAAAPVILFACDAAGTVKLAEGRAVALLGVGTGLVVGSNVFEVLSGVPEAVEHVRRGLAGESFVGTIRLETLDLSLEMTYDPVRDDAGAIVGMVALATDVSDRIRGDAARLESEAKSRLVAMVNHEVRTPLTSILGFAGLLRMERAGALNSKQRRYVDRVEAAGRHLLAMVNDSLDLSKLSAGKMNLEITPLAVRPIVEEAGSLVQPLVEERGIRLRVTIDGELWVEGDRRRLLQILWNLLSNAIRHGAAGGEIAIECRRAGHTVEIVVADDGTGIAADQLPRIFDDYAQVGANADGTGLGLPVSRRLALLMDGAVDAVSEPGVGSRFTLTLPAAEPPEEDWQ